MLGLVPWGDRVRAFAREVLGAIGGELRPFTRQVVGVSIVRVNEEGMTLVATESCDAKGGLLVPGGDEVESRFVGKPAERLRKVGVGLGVLDGQDERVEMVVRDPPEASGRWCRRGSSRRSRLPRFFLGFPRSGVFAALFAA